VTTRPSEPPAAPRPRRSTLVRALSWILPGLLVAGLTVGAIRLATPPGPETELSRFLPFETGTTWRYETRTDGKATGFHVAQVTGSTRLSNAETGVIIENSWENYFNGGPLKLARYVSEKGGRLIETGNRIGATFASNSPPQPVVVTPLVRGRTWHWKGSRLNQDQTATTTMVALESIDVMGKPVDDCAHLRSRIQAKDSQGKSTLDVIDSWLCPGLGLARSRDAARTSSGTNVEEETLVAIHGPDINEGVTHLGFKTLAPQAGATSGIDQARTGFVPGARLDARHFAWTMSRKENALFSPVGRPGLMILAEDDGNLSATDPESGQILWQVRLEAPIVAQPVVAGSVVLVAAANKSLYSLEVATGATRWVDTFPDVVSTTPVVGGGAILAITEDGTARVLDPGNGHQTSSVKLGAVVAGPPATSGDLAVVADQGGGLTAISLPKGTVRWTAGLTDVLAENTGPVISGDEVIAVQEGGSIHAFSLQTGSVQWTKVSAGAINASPAATDGLLVSVAADHVEALSLSDGAELWRVAVGETVDVSPMVLGDTVAVLDVKAGLHLYDLDSGAGRGTVELPPPDPSVEVSTEQPMSYVDGALLVPEHVTPHWPFTILLAFPAPTGGEPGSIDGVGLAGHVRLLPSSPVRLGGEIQLFPSNPTTPPVLRDGHLFLGSTFGESAWDLPPAGPPVQLVSHTATGFAVPAGNFVLVQANEDLEAVPHGGGIPVWTHHMGSPSFVVRPAVVDDTVVVPVQGKGLEGIDVRTGAARWSHATPNPQGFSTPLVLPDGGVAYAVGSMVVLDPGTGRVRWEKPGFNAVAPIAYSDGSIYAEVLGSKGFELIAVEAQTGKIRWEVPFNAALGVGPGAGDGVVAAVDGGATLTVLDEATGHRMWSVPLRTASNGDPVVVDGRVAVQEQGRFEDVQQRDYRLEVFDAQTGRMAAEWEFAGSGFPGVASFGAQGDLLLVPGIGAEFLVRMEGP
jgi:outer membrane protein assembly factor BamB